MTVCSGPEWLGQELARHRHALCRGQRRYVESLSSYARQSSHRCKSRSEQISGLSPAVSIEQKTTSKSPRSTVGTVTEIHDYLRILFARLGQPYCPGLRRSHCTQTPTRSSRRSCTCPKARRSTSWPRSIARDNEDYAALWDDLRGSGFARVAWTEPRTASILPELSHRRKHRIERRDRPRDRPPPDPGRGLPTRSRRPGSGQSVVHVARVGDEADEPSLAGRPL